MTRPGIEPGSLGPLANTNHYANVRVVEIFFMEKLDQVKFSLV